MKPKDLELMFGQRNRVYEVLNGKRKLTMTMVYRLHTGLDIPAESLIRQLGRGSTALHEQVVCV